MEYIPAKRPSGARRFANVMLAFPGIRIIWCICTFGYKFPTKRRGENLIVCIFQATVVFVVRFFCIMGAIWYINAWAEYTLQGKARPFNILERQEVDAEGTLAPYLNFFSTETNKIDILGITFQNMTDEFAINYSYGINGGITSVGPDDNYKLNADNFTSLQYMIRHNPPLPAFPWTRVSLLHPLNNLSFYSEREKPNQYFFLPGHFVEIRYTPQYFYEVYDPNVNPDGTERNNATVLQKFKAFMGYGGDVEIPTYQSTVEHIPFPTGMYDNMTSIIILRPEAKLVIKTYASEDVTFRDTMSKIGGLIGLVGSMLVFLFGASLMSPWGFIAGVPFFRRRISGSLAKAYDNEDGLSKGPFTIKIEEVGSFDPDVRTVDEKMTFLKERVDELEIVLREYYLSSEVFQYYAEERKKLKLARTASVVSRATGKASLGGHYSDQRPQPLMLPSQTLMESQQQHRGQLPSPQFPPSYARQSSDQLGRHAPEPSVSTYYQQQQQHQQQQRSRR
ncbi:hypothetical protein BGZ54_000377, partial [Gamsiella multidivaricata]